MGSVNCLKVDKDWVSVVLAVLILLLGSSLYAQEGLTKKTADQILALGIAKVVENNIAAAREDAISMAISNGVEYYLLNKLGKNKVADNLDRLVEGILPKAKELVEYYHVVKEVELEQRYTLLLQLKINEKLATEMLLEQGLLVASTKPIRILFLVGNVTKGVSEHWWTQPEEIPPLSPVELALFRAFQDKGFDLIDRTMSLPPKEVTHEMRKAKLTLSVIKTWGEIYGADVVIYGMSEVDNLGKVCVALQVVGVADGVVRCRLSETGLADAQGGPQEITAAIERIVRRMMPRLETCVNEAGGAQETNCVTFEVTLKGLSNYIEYKKLKDFLSKRIAGVREFKQSKIGSHYVSFRVKFQGNEKKFVDLVMFNEDLPVPITGVEKKQGEVVFVVGRARKGGRTSE